MDITLVRLEQISNALKVPIASFIPQKSGYVQINQEHSNNNFLNSTQINQSDPTVKEMLQILLEKLGK
jgi:hypothetical protein